MSTEILKYLAEATTENTGREAEVGAVLREHDEAKALGRARFVSVRGAIGVGKSHLVREIVQTLSRRGVPVFEGASGRDSRQTWGAFSSLVGSMLSHLSRTGIPEQRLAALATQVASVTSGTASTDRASVFAGVTELFALAGRSCPVFVLPDLDVADRSSLELLKAIAGAASTPESAVGGLFVLTFRDDTSLPTALVETLERTHCKAISLTGLDLEGIRTFLARGDVAQKLLELTGGNPETLGALIERPATSSEFFARRAERLTEAQRAVMAVLSLAPQALTVETLAQATGTPAETLAVTLDLLASERLVAVKMLSGKAAWKFARESEKTTFAAMISEDVRRAAALKLGRALVESGALMLGAELLLPVAPEEGAAVAVKAAQALVDQGALEEAAALYSSVAPRLGTPARAEVAQIHAQTLALLGAYRPAARRFLTAARLTSRPALLIHAARMLVKVGRLAMAERVVKGNTSSEAQAIIAELHLLRGETEAAVKQCRATLSDATAPAALHLRNVLGKALLVQGKAAEAEEVFAENVKAATAANDQQFAALARLNQGVAAFKKGDRDAAITAWTMTPATHRPAHAQAQANLGSAYAENGDFEPALEHLSRALQSFSQFSAEREESMAASNLARLVLFLGELPRAEELAQHALDRAARLGDRYLQASALLTRASVKVDQKKPQEAMIDFDAARTLFERVGNMGYAALAAALKARTHLGAHERAQAELELARTCVTEGAGSLPAAELEVALTRADLALSLGDLHAAGRHGMRAREAMLSENDLEGPIRTAVVMGRLRQAASDSSGAQSEFQRAARMLEELVKRVPAARREAFLAVPRRSEVLAAVEPELRLARVTSTARASQLHHERLPGLIGRSAALQHVVKQLEPIGRSNATVLVRGESGTGKEVLADALHSLSPRQHMPIVKVNCAAMVEELLLSELFGHEKGAFTGAIRERKGRFEMADGGTIFLDEIGDISPKAQVALLRVLQEREFERVGGSKTIKVDVRVICATNRDLEAAIADGRFRADLYYRLKGVMLELPPLRNRLEDLGSLAQHFLTKATTERNQAPQRLSEDALALLKKHTWPGNIRELENVVSSASIFAEGTVVTPAAFMHVAELKALMGDVPVEAQAAHEQPVIHASHAAVAAEAVPAGPIDFYELARARGISLKDLRHEIEMQCIRRALVESDGNISEAARLLLMKRSRLSQIVNAEPMLREVAHGE